jgi:ribosomal protein L6P/L9E
MKQNFNLLENFQFKGVNIKVEPSFNAIRATALIQKKGLNLSRSLPLHSTALHQSQVYLQKNYVNTILSSVKEALFQFKKSEPYFYLAQLRLVGIGYRVFQFQIKNTAYLIFDLGSSKLTIVKIPNLVQVRAEKSSILIYGDSLFNVRSFWSQIANLKKPDVYKGKGIQKLGVVYRLKEGKKK